MYLLQLSILKEFSIHQMRQNMRKKLQMVIVLCLIFIFISSSLFITVPRSIAVLPCLRISLLPGSSIDFNFYKTFWSLQVSSRSWVLALHLNLIFNNCEHMCFATLFMLAHSREISQANSYSAYLLLMNIISMNSNHFSCIHW